VTSPYNIKPTPFGQKYALLNHIKSGGMAEVWLGKMLSAGGVERLVAIKRILPHVAESAEFISMFIDEAKITVQLNHPNICRVFELGQDLEANSYYIVMEYVHGRDLRALFDGCVQSAKLLPIPAACYIIARCCDGLNYAHGRKDAQGKEMCIVHRDVSLQNILVGFEGEVKIIDFGIAKAVDKSTKTAAGTLKGKFSYMSPEQICGPPEKVDRRADVFGLGICLYELLTGKRLFSGKTDFSVLEKVRKAEVALPSTLNREISPELERIVMKALARDAEERYQYAGEMGEDLWHLLYGLEETFDRQNLTEYMQTSFAQQYAKEKIHLQACLEVPASIEPSGNYPVLVEQTDENGQAVVPEPPDNTILVRTTEALTGDAKAQPDFAQEQADMRHEKVPESKSMPSLQSTSKSTEAVASTPTPAAVLATLSDRNKRTPEDFAPKPSVITRSTRTPPSAAEPKRSALKKYAWVGAVALLALTVAVGVVAWPRSTGEILVEVPEELKEGGNVKLLLNNKEMKDKDGGPIQKWPRLFRVTAGKWRVSMSAEGYEPLVEEVQVPKSENEHVRLPKTLQKQLPPQEAP